jgi:hypothetical protein
MIKRELDRDEGTLVVSPEGRPRVASRLTTPTGTTVERSR